ncbi:MAG: hypothetical protein KDC46_10595 [Thermoleophilia bacterium]|nr:hypothetical protein [Thermoleophilia bacterium]
MTDDEPKLRSADKIPPPYKLGAFPRGFTTRVGGRLIALFATQSSPSVTGDQWEEIFAHAIGATWKPSNIGLDDIVLSNCCWGAKTVKGATAPGARIRLISGRNSPAFSYGTNDVKAMAPGDVGRQVLKIWNARVDSVRARFAHVRVVVLVKSKEHNQFAVFEHETLRFDPDLYRWSWNRRGNLEGHHGETGEHRFTWQPHGSQFTIIERIPENAVVFRIQEPPKLDPDSILLGIGFSDQWVQVVIP